LLEDFDGVIVLDKEEESVHINPPNVLFRSTSIDEITNFVQTRILIDNFSGTVYFKASRAVQLDQVVDRILNLREV